MKLPIYKEIPLTGNLQHLKNSVAKTLQINCPKYIDLQEYDEEQVDTILMMLVQIIRSNRMSQLFPYPLYVLASSYYQDHGFVIYHQKRDLPQYFAKKYARVTVKERKLLMRNKILVTKINNGDVENLGERVRRVTLGQRQLFKLNAEHTFYRHVLENL
ncbi:MAG: hypothetical protein HN623_04050 [Bdellovibrionales bacterium]|jgi:hypothetical protein|nr:hypothetical protein [Bdellovibrionales bacterium]